MAGIIIHGIYYDPEENTFVDEDGLYFGDIHRLLTPYRLQYLKEVRGVEYVKDCQPGIYYEIVFPSFDLDDEY